MKMFLTYFFSDKMEGLRSEIIKHYDPEFVDKEILNPLKDKYHKISASVNSITESN